MAGSHGEALPECGHGGVPRPWCWLLCIWAGDGAQPLLSLHTQLLDCDQDLYKNFPLVISERWQQEVVETIYDAVNADTDKIEARRKAKNKQLGQEKYKPLVIQYLEERAHPTWVLRGLESPGGWKCPLRGDSAVPVLEYPHPWNFGKQA